MRETVAACLIVLNERERIAAALSSVRFCDEIVVVDGGSTDGTPEIAESLGAKVVRNPWPGYARQRNVAIDAADSDWILEVDADERVSPELRRSIDAFLRDAPPSVDMAVLPLREVFLGKPLGPAAKYPLYRARLFRRGAYRHDEGRVVHEGLWPAGPVQPLSGDLVHLVASTWREAVRDAVRYARLQALHHPKPGPATLLLQAVLRPVAKLWYRAVVLGGWRDGMRGLARIGLECFGDALSWLYALRHGGSRADGAHVAPSVGPIRIVGLALTARGAKACVAWLEEAAGVGADVALVARDGPGDRSIRIRRLRRAGPGHVAREIEAEAQVRPIDAIVPCDLPAAMLLRVLRPPLRRAIRRVDPGRSPAATVQTMAKERGRQAPGASR